MIAAPILVRLAERAGIETGARFWAYTSFSWMGLLFLFLTVAGAVDVVRLAARERHEQALVKQLRHSLVHFPPDRRINLPQLVEYVKRSVEEFQVQIVVIDHFHRMNFGGASAHYRIQVQEAARELKDLARSFGVVVVASAQLNTDPHPLDRYYPPVLKRLKESSGLGEEANVVLMLSRRLREAPSPDKLVAIRSGHIEIRDLEEPSLMVVTCRKSRLKDSARDRAVYLNVVNGRVTDRLSRWSGATP